MATEISTSEQFEHLLPKLTKDERNALEESLQKEGCRDPIVTWHNTIIDGHNRYSICTKYDIPFNVKKMDEFSDEDAVKTWIINNQLSRRNLTDEQRERFLGILFNTNKKERGGVRDNSGRKSKVHGEPLISTGKEESDNTTDTAGMIAKQHGISRATAKRAGKFATALDRISKISPAAEAKIMSGEAKNIISRKEIRNLAEAPEAEVKKVIKAIEKDAPVKMAKTTEKELPVRQVYKIINDIEIRTDTLTDMMGKLTGSHGQLTDEDRTEIANLVDNLANKMQLIWQNFL
jgi:hypothetical protein